MTDSVREIRERLLRESGVPTVRCDDCNALVARDFSWHECTVRYRTLVGEPAPIGDSLGATTRQEPRPRASSIPEAWNYVPEWAEKL